jgi:hypothetical protein
MPSSFFQTQDEPFPFPNSENFLFLEEINIEININDYSKQLKDFFAFKLPTEKNLNNFEDYELNFQFDEVNKKFNIILKSETVFGAIHGITTINQLIETKIHPINKYPIGCINEFFPVNIIDSPKFHWRGLSFGFFF